MEKSFRDVQESVGNCPKLFYVDLKLPIHVSTDASDYGIGGVSSRPSYMPVAHLDP